MICCLDELSIALARSNTLFEGVHALAVLVRLSHARIVFTTPWELVPTSGRRTQRPSASPRLTGHPFAHVTERMS
ncbi:MAG TPA: hypothetical protein VLK65_25205, partial [Vicinamibacteria bacterium]|nr:hypothetical protein [Vicinamibacteria bacterium]